MADGVHGRVGRLAIAFAAALVAVAAPAPATRGAATEPPRSAAEAVTYQGDARHDGYVADPAFTAPLALAWTAALDGSVGFPLIADGRVFVALARRDDSGTHVEALSLATGEVVWGPVAVGGGGYQWGTIAYDAGRVFAVNFFGQLTALDAASGVILWREQLPGQYAFSSPPTPLDGTLFVAGAGSGATLYAVDETSGAVKWATPSGAGENTAPVVDASGIYVSGACELTYRFGLDGGFRWRHETGCTGGGGHTAVLHDGLLYVRDNAGEAPAVLDAATGHQVGIFSSELAPAFDPEGHVATVTDGVLSVAATTATSPTDPIWSSSGATYVTDPLIVNRYVIAGRSGGTVDVRDVADGSLVWSGNIGAEISRTDEFQATPLAALAEGGGALAVPAGSTLSVLVRATHATATITDGPGPDGLVGRSTAFSFRSDLDGARFSCTFDGLVRPCTSPFGLTDLGDGPHEFSVGVVGSDQPPTSRAFTTDAEAPRVDLRSLPAHIRSHRTTARWSATDARSGVLAYQLQVRRSRPKRPWSAWSARPPSTAESVSLRLRRGDGLCVSVRAVDAVGNWSGWSSASCVRRRVR